MRALIRVFLTTIPVLIGLVMAGAGARAASPLVDAAWLARHGGEGRVVVVDVRSPADYRAGHIPGAVRTDYGKDGWRVTDGAGTPLMFPARAPDLERLVTSIGGLGIANDSHVILVPYGRDETDVGVATRIYWSFKVLGHDEVSVLDGGMRAYRRSGGAVESGVVAARPARFVAAIRDEMLVDSGDVRAALADNVALLDARPHIQHIGLQRSPLVARAGTIPGATSLPAQWATRNGGGRFRGPDDLRRLYDAAGAPGNASAIVFCNTGHWASVTWFVTSELLGNAGARLFDGSMAEWAADAINPVERRFAID